MWKHHIRMKRFFESLVLLLTERGRSINPPFRQTDQHSSQKHLGKKKLIYGASAVLFHFPIWKTTRTTNQTTLTVKSGYRHHSARVLDDFTAKFSPGEKARNEHWGNQPAECSARTHTHYRTLSLTSGILYMKTHCMQNSHLSSEH
jgi:hypothetical protein